MVFGVDEQRAHAAMFFEAGELAAVFFAVVKVAVEFADFFEVGEEGAGVVFEFGLQPVDGNGESLRPGGQCFGARGKGTVFRQQQLVGEGIGGERFFNLPRETVEGFVRDGVNLALGKEDFRPAPALVAGDERAQYALHFAGAKPPFAGGNECGEGVVTGLCGHAFCPAVGKDGSINETVVMACHYRHLEPKQESA